MKKLTDELKATLRSAKSEKEAAALLKDAGVDEPLAGRLWNELSRSREEKELDIDELETVSGGADRDWLKEGCAATVEAGSWCGTNDKCVWIDVQYDHVPVKDTCPQCGGQMYLDRTEVVRKGEAYDYCKCLRCGYVKKSRR